MFIRYENGYDVGGQVQETDVGRMYAFYKKTRDMIEGVAVEIVAGTNEAEMSELPTDNETTVVLEIENDISESNGRYSLLVTL